MDLFEAVNTRRSIRRFTGEEVTKADLEKILRAGMQAPSAKNYRPWHFIVVDKKEILGKVKEYHPYSDMLETAPLAVFVCGDMTLELSQEYCAVDCAAASENMLLAARAIGLGAVWMGIYPRKDRMEGTKLLLNLPDYIVPVSCIAIGHPDEEKKAVDRFLPNRIKYNGWK